MIDGHSLCWGITATFWFLAGFAIFEDAQIVLPSMNPPPMSECPNEPLACTRREFFRQFYIKNRLKERMVVFSVFGGIAAIVATRFPPLQ